MQRKLYTLEPSGKVTHQPCETTWREWFADPAQRIVARATLAQVTVETAFMGLDLREFGMWAAPSPLFFATWVRRHTGEPLKRTFSDTLLAALAEHETAVSHAVRGSDD